MYDVLSTTTEPISLVPMAHSVARNIEKWVKGLGTHNIEKCVKALGAASLHSLHVYSPFTHFLGTRLAGAHTHSACVVSYLGCKRNTYY